MNERGDRYLVRIIHRRNQVACWTIATQTAAIDSAKDYLKKHVTHRRYQVVDLKAGIVAAGEVQP